MVKVKHTPTPHDANSYTIVGDSIDELTEECLKRIRAKSQDYYRVELENDLKKSNQSLIDRHAGMGSYYKVKFQENG